MMKHNKKRNTIFLFKVLSRELTKSILENNFNKKEKIKNIIKNSFSSNTELLKEKKLYDEILLAKNLKNDIAERIYINVINERKKIDNKKLFDQQNKLIDNINKILGEDVYDNFIPNYRSLATIYQLFNKNLSPSKKVMLEQKVFEEMANKPESKKVLEPIDSLVLKRFIEKFNKKYNDNLLEEQKLLLQNFIKSFEDGGIELKVFVNEEIRRIKNILNDNKNLFDTEYMKNQYNNINEVIEEFSKTKINDSSLKKLLKLQTLAKEILNED